MTPIDEYAFVGDPPMLRPEIDEVHVSVSFTWDRYEAQRLADAWGQYYPKVKVGGPIYGDVDGFVPGLYVKHGVTFTSRGCNKNCWFCLVPKWEGKLRLLEIRPGHIIQDNNLLQTGRGHMGKVFTMLRKQRQIQFSGGLDFTLVDDWVAEELRGLSIGQVFLACDSDAALKPLRRAVGKLSFLPRRKLRCYVLIGNQPIGQAKDRLRAVWEAGCLPFAQLYQPPDQYIHYNQEWRELQRTWTRPAIMFAEMTSHND